MKKRIISLALSAIMCISLSIPALASAPSNNVITFEEYSQTIIAEYAKYGRQVEVVSHDPNTVYTRDMLEEHLQYIGPITLTFSEGSFELIDGPNARSMQRNFRYTHTFGIESNDFPLKAAADFTCECEGVVDIQNNHVSYISDYSVWEEFSFNLDSWDLDMTARKNYPTEGEVYLEFDGMVIFEWTDPIANTVWRDPVNYEYGWPFDADEYI